MNERKIKESLFFMLICISFLLPAGWGEERLYPIKGASYDSQTGELLIENVDRVAVAPEKISHSARRKEIVFFMPNTLLQPTPQVVEVKDDPVIKSINLEQRALEGIPAVRVEIDLYTNSPYLPFQVNPVSPGLKIRFSYWGNQDPTGKDSSSIASTKPFSPSSFNYKSLFGGRGPNHSSGTLSLSSNPNTTASDRVEQKAEQKAEVVNSVVGPVSQDTYSIIHDVFYDNNSLTVISKKLPISIERSFILTEPNRYVVDLSPAVLVSKSLIRAVPQNNPSILNFKTGQLDEDTVRIVVQFSKQVAPVNINQLENNRILKLTFN